MHAGPQLLPLARALHIMNNNDNPNHCAKYISVSGSMVRCAMGTKEVVFYIHSTLSCVSDSMSDGDIVSHSQVTPKRFKSESGTHFK